MIASQYTAPIRVPNPPSSSATGWSARSEVTTSETVIAPSPASHQRCRLSNRTTPNAHASAQAAATTSTPMIREASVRPCQKAGTAAVSKDARMRAPTTSDRRRPVTFSG